MVLIIKFTTVEQREISYQNIKKIITVEREDSKL